MVEPIHQCLPEWHRIVAERDMAALGDLLHPDATFRSPVAHTPYRGAMVLALALSTVIEVFEDFTYHREFVTGDGRHAVLEFSAKVGEKAVKGIDMIEVDDDGKIVNFEVMVRPLSGLSALADEMGARIGPLMQSMKGK